MRALKIVVLSTLAAILYGILHDQVTARVCLEYFTIGHPPIFPTRSPTLLAIGWGIIATWWVGLPLGCALALAARAGGSRPKLEAHELVRPIGVLLLCMFALALVAGLSGAFLASRGQVWLVEPLKTAVPADRQVAFLADLWAHTASYLGGLVGGIGLAIWTWKKRGRLAASTGDGLVGTWRLLSFEDWDVAGKRSAPFGEEPRGYFIFDATGHVSICIMRTPALPAFASAELYGGTPAEKQAAYDAYFSYFGTYRVEAGRFETHVEGSLYPSFTGTDQPRAFTLQGNSLTLGDGKSWSRTLVRVR